MEATPYQQNPGVSAGSSGYVIEDGGSRVEGPRDGSLFDNSYNFLEASDMGLLGPIMYETPTNEEFTSGFFHNLDGQL